MTNEELIQQMNEMRLIIAGMFPFALYGLYRFIKWIGRKDKENGLG